MEINQPHDGDIQRIVSPHRMCVICVRHMCVLCVFQCLHVPYHRLTTRHNNDDDVDKSSMYLAYIVDAKWQSDAIVCNDDTKVQRGDDRVVVDVDDISVISKIEHNHMFGGVRPSQNIIEQMAHRLAEPPAG